MRFVLLQAAFLIITTLFVLTDIHMPKMSGFEVYRRIKDTNPLMPIAFISAFEINEDEFSKVMQSIKVRDFIKKPIRIPRIWQSG